MTIVPVLLAVVAFLGWGIGDSISIKLFRKNDPAVITFFSGIYRILIWLIFLPLFFKDARNISLIPLLFNLLAGLSSGLGYYFYGKAAKLTNPALVAAIAGGWGGSALIYSLIFFKETITHKQWLSIGLIFSGLIFATFNADWFKKIKLKNNRGFFYAFLTFIVWGLCGAFLKIPAVSYGWYWTSLIMLIPYFLVILLTVKKEIHGPKLKISLFGLFIIIVLLAILGDLGYNSSLQFGGKVAIVGTIAGSYAVLSTLLAYLIYKEPLTKKQTLGIIICLTGIVLTAYFSSVL